MAQLSRPYQIALGGLAVLVLVWFVALRGHAGSPSEPAPSSAPSASQTQPPAPSSASGAAGERAAGAPSRIYHGPAPGVEGLTRAIAKAHGAVATSQRTAAQLKAASARASGESPSSGPAAAAGPRTAADARRSGSRISSHASASSHRHTTPRARGGSGTSISHARAGAGTRPVSHAHAEAGTRERRSRSSASGLAPQQLAVEGDLRHGKTVLVLFWDPKSSVDDAVRSQVLALGAKSKGKLAVHVALADQVGLFGPVTEVAQVYQTPTILIVGRHGLITTLTGLVDKFFLQQAVREAQSANR